MFESNKNHFSSIAMMLVVLRISFSSCQIAYNELPNTDLYRAYLNDLLGRSKQVKRADNYIPFENTQHENATSDSAYERVMSNLRTNWEMPANYLQKRGYLTKSNSKLACPGNDLSMDAYNLINGPLLNPSTFKNIYPVPHGPNALQPINSERSDQMNQENEYDGHKRGTERRSYNENLIDCSNLSMMNNLACLEQYLGETWVRSARDKWNSWLHKNQSTTTTPATTTVTSTTTTTTTISPITESTNITNTTSEVINDLSIQDAQDGLEFFKIYNDFMLAKLASKLSQSEHERRMLNSAQNPEQNFPKIVQNPTPQVANVPDFSKINENDIQILKDLDNCLRRKKNRPKIDGNENEPIIMSDVEGTGDVTDDRQVSSSYLPTKLKFLAHLHHEVDNIGHIKPLSKDQSTLSKNLNGNDCNVDVTNFGITNSTYSFAVK